MKTKYHTVVAAFLAVFTLMFNPVSALAGTTTKSVAPKGDTTSAKAPIDVVPKKATKPVPAPTPAVPVAKPEPKPEPKPSPAEVTAAPKADYVVTQTAFESAIIKLTQLAEQGAQHDRQQDDRLDALECRVTANEANIETNTIRLKEVDANIVRLQQDVGGVVVRLAKVEENVVRLRTDVDTNIVRLKEMDANIVRLAQPSVSTATATAAASAASATSSSAQQPTIIVVPMPAMNSLPATSTTSYTTPGSCTQARTSVPTVRLAPSPPRVRTVSAPPPAPVTASYGCRPGIFTRLGNFLFGSGCAPAVAPVISVPPMNQFCGTQMPQQRYCAPQSGCFTGRQQCMPSGFGWQQPMQPRVQYAMRPPCNNYGGSWGGGGSRPSNVVVTSNNNNNNLNNNNNNNNLVALLGQAGRR